MLIRTADSDRDSAFCADIYASYVLDTSISFEYEPPNADEFASRINASLIWLVAEQGNEIVGYAYAAQHRERAAYRWAADAAVYVRWDAQRLGVGRALYSDLIGRCRASGLRMLCAGITQPNAASNAFHEALGFEPGGTYRRIGWKAGAWHDVTWYQLDLAPGDLSPPTPLRFETS